MRYICGNFKEHISNRFKAYFCRKDVVTQQYNVYIVAVAALLVFAGFICACGLMNRQGSTEQKLPVRAIEYVNTSGEECVCYENIIAITFDDGPRADTTNKLLDGLKQRNVKATFFLIGKNIEGNENIVKRMVSEGHLVGNHTNTHIDLSDVSPDTAYKEVMAANDLICSITGEEPEYIRPPFGKYSEKLMLQIDMEPVLWSIDSLDWNTEDVHSVVENVVNNVKCGDIILLHDIYDSSVTAALEIIDRLQEKGYVFVTVDQLILE